MSASKFQMTLLLVSGLDYAQKGRNLPSIYSIIDKKMIKFLMIITKKVFEYLMEENKQNNDLNDEKRRF